MSRKTSDVFRTSFLTMDGTFDPNNSQLFFRALQAPLNTTDNTFYSLGAAQINDPSLRINKYDASGGLLNYGYLYDTQFNPLPPNNLLIVAGGIGTNTLIYSENSVSWVPSQTGLADACLAIAYDGFTWLAGGIDNSGHITVVYSSNGRDWLANIGGSSLFTEWCTALATNGSVWVGGGRNEDAVIGFSYDGLQWLVAPTQTIFTGTNISVIAQNDILWLAGASQYQNGTVPNALAYAPDGIHWSPVDLSGTPMDNVYAICWNGSLWLVGGDLNSVASIIYSTDGYTWFSSTSANVIPSSIRALSWNGLQFVAGGYDSVGQGRTLAYSYDGIYWTASTSTNIFSSFCNGITWDGNKWEAVGIKGYNEGFSIATSLDGLIWAGNESGTRALPQGYAIAINKPLPFTAPKTPNPSITAPLTLLTGINPQFGSAIGYSTDGIAWNFLPNAATIAQGSLIGEPTWNGRLWVAGITPRATGFPTLIYSYDGITWNVSTSATAVANSGVGRIAWGNDKFIAVARFDNQYQCVIESLDGINWSRINSLTRSEDAGFGQGLYTDVEYNGSTWVITGRNSGPPDGTAAITYSLDNGVTWQVSASASNIVYGFMAVKGIAWNGHIWSLVFYKEDIVESAIAYSRDAINWTEGNINVSQLNFNASYIRYNGTMFIMSGTANTSIGIYLPNTYRYLFYSYDGITFYRIINIPGGSDTYILSVDWTGSVWIATGYSLFALYNNLPNVARILYSYNGIIWYLSYNGSEYLTSIVGYFSFTVGSSTGTNSVNPTAGNILPPSILNQGLTAGNGYGIFTSNANNLYKSSVLYLDESNGILGINQTSQNYTDLNSTNIKATLEISKGGITMNTYTADSVPGTYLTANNVSAGSGGRIELKDAVNNKGWRIDNNVSANNHLQIKAYNNNVGTLCMDFGTTRNIGIGTIADNSYKLKVDGNMNVTEDSTVSGTGKLFMIDHPDPALNKTHYLRHSCVEGPTRGDNLYRWTVRTTNKSSRLSLPSYSPYLNENWQFIVRATDSFGKGYVTLSDDETFFTLTTNEEGIYSILGIATRKDQASLSFDKQGVEFVPVK